MFKNLVFIALIFISFGCANQAFFETEKLNSLRSDKQENSTLFYEKKYQVTDDGRLFEFTHIVVQSSNSKKSQGDYLTVLDNSQSKLQTFSARLVQLNGKEKEYSAKDLIKFSLSNRGQISESFIKILPISDDIKPGDIIELAYSHEMTLPGLGMSFSVEEAGKKSSYTSCVFEIPKDKDLFFKVFNDSIAPSISVGEKIKKYSFEWRNFKEKENSSVFSSYNTSPIILATMPVLSEEASAKKISDWKDFGNWYIGLINAKLKSDPSIKSMADSLTGNLSTVRERMDAVFNFCQKNIRYEQVYLDKGEFIPNDYDVILKRKYGDCKDYSMVIYTLFKNMGYDPKLTLCFRGRGGKFFDEMPVSQFNHMIVYCNIDGKDLWYDGTNRIGLAGIPTSDLINQTALIIDQDNSHLKKIEESPENLFKISGNLTESGLNLKGNLKFSFASQYAIDFNYVNMFFNQLDMKDYLIRWMKGNLNKNLSVKSIEWKNSDNVFEIDATIEIPNSILSISPNYYISFSRIFPALISGKDIPEDRNSIFYYPDYNRIKVDLRFDNLVQEFDGSNKIEFNFDVPAGPFTEQEKNHFTDAYKLESENFNKKIKLVGKK